jgi:hypothetical protein
VPTNLQQLFLIGSHEGTVLLFFTSGFFFNPQTPFDMDTAGILHEIYKRIVRIERECTDVL